jgi:Zn-dependent alcohol dehydrogenase
VVFAHAGRLARHANAGAVGTPFGHEERGTRDLHDVTLATSTPNLQLPSQAVGGKLTPMRAAVLESIPGHLSILNVTVNKPGPGEVLVRTAAAGLCHSDLHFMEGLYPHPVPSVLGHESAGVVEAVGEGVTYVQPGDHVITCLSAYCGGCEYCLTGRLSICNNRTAKSFQMLRPGGTATVIGMIPYGTKIEIHGADLLAERRFQGSNMGSNRFRIDMPRYIDLYMQGRLKLDELVSARIKLDDINEGFASMKSGAIARNVIVF